MKYSSIFFKIISQHFDKFKNIEDLKDLNLIISRISHLLNQNNNNKTNIQHDDNSFSHINFLKIFNKTYEELKYQYFIIQNLNISLITLEYHNLKLTFQQFSHELKIKLLDIFEEKISEYNIFISQYLFIFHIYLIIKYKIYLILNYKFIINIKIKKLLFNLINIYNILIILI